MHYFIDHNQLTDQATTGNPYGPDSSDLNNKFNITSRFQLTNQSKAFACQDSLMIVQQSSVDSSLVNVILKPIEGLKIPFRPVKYYVYRGLLKESFISNAAIKPKNVAPANSFLKRFWEDVDHWNNNNPSNQSTPTPQIFGYDDTLSNTLDIEKIYDNSQTDVRAILVKEGEWIGDFGTTKKIGFEVILETSSFYVADFNYPFDLSYLRAEYKCIDITGLLGFDKRAKQELILSYIDPAAFFGLHYEAGINISVFSGGNKTLENKKQNDLYTLLIEKFATRNRLYIDIRSEKGYSYNFYQNYNSNSNDNIKIGNGTTTPVAQSYSTNNWPIVFTDTPVTTSNNVNNIKISVRIDDNIKPIIFIENTALLGSNNRSKFINENEILNETTTGWSKDLMFQFPNTGNGSTRDNVAYYIKLNYFRQHYNPSSPNSILKNENYFDSAFCPINLPNIAENNYKFQQIHNHDINYVRGVLPNITKEFGYVANSGAFWDNERVLFYSQAIFQNISTNQFFDYIANVQFNFGFNLSGDFNKMSFLSKDVKVTKTNVQEGLVTNDYQKIKLLDIENYNGFPNAFENIFCLGITHTEFTSLKNITGFSDKHNRYIYIEEISGSPFNDKDGKPFRKFKLKIQGLDSSGNRLIIAPSTNIFVYNQLGLVFASKDFADKEINQSGLVYKRNYEENIGIANNEPITHKHYEDYFIDNINSNMKTEVDGFIDTLATIANDENAYQNIKTLVEDSAKDIWNEAVNFVQANNNANPDDRPLYWARNKMQVALKSHVYFENQFLFSEVNKGSELEKMVQLFEEKSRNYTGIDFSAAPTGAKKILITGFDPFFLNEKHPIFGANSNIRQWNPSGQAVLSLHGKTISNGFIQTMIFPVRYIDFDKGYVEKYIMQHIHEVDMIITISQGLYRYDIERFASKFRTSSTIDNLNVVLSHQFYLPSSNGITQINESIIPEFLETTLPVNSMIPGSLGNNLVVFNQKYRGNLTSAPYSAPNSGTSNITGPNNTEKALEGSGGTYLSNEIFYRVAVSRNHLGLNGTLKSGHLHVPILDIDDLEQAQTDTLNVKIIIENAIQGL